MIQLQIRMCCMFLPLLYGCIQVLLKLKTDYMSVFEEDTGQEYLRKGVVESIQSRVASRQLTDENRKFLLRSMLMEPYLKCKIDVKQQDRTSKIFPEWIKLRLIEECKKQLSSELSEIIKINTVDQIVSDGSSSGEEQIPKKKKKKDVIILEYLNEEEDHEIGNGEEKWFKKLYLDNDVGINSVEASEIYWKDRAKTYSNVIRLLCKYRSVGCSSIFEEECFSTIKKMATADRESQKGSTIESMMFCKKNWYHFNQ